MKFYSGFIYKYFNNFMKTFSNFNLFHTENISQKCMDVKIKVHVFWEGHTIWRNLLLTCDWLYIEQKWGGKKKKICDLLWIYELYAHYIDLSY